MKLTNMFSILSTVLAVTLLGQTIVSAQVVVTEINSSSNATDDWFELTNVGAAAIDMSGWKFDDYPENAGNAAELLDADLMPLTIAPGESIAFVEYDSDIGGTFADQITTFRAAWGGLSGVQVGMHQGSGLGRDDGVSIFDATDTLVAQHIYFDPLLDPPADLHAGESVGATNIDSAIWDPTTPVDFSTPSTNTFVAPVAGIYGVFSASDGGLGSPGLVNVIPEPSSITMILLAAVALFRRR